MRTSTMMFRMKRIKAWMVKRENAAKFMDAIAALDNSQYTRFFNDYSIALYDMGIDEITMIFDNPMEFVGHMERKND